MRIIAEYSKPQGRVTVFAMNNKYVVKIENGNLEQIFKINVLDTLILDAADLEKILDERFMDNALQRFREMQQDLMSGLEMHQLL
jgi:hypothetical protein